MSETTTTNFGAKIPKRRLGRTNLLVPAVSLGGVGLGGGYGPVPENEGIEAAQYALSEGINYIDTSPLYADSERRLGIALEGVPRGDYILSTKTGTHPERRGDFSWDGTLWSVENSLRLLKTDYIDVLLIHDPDDLEPVFAPRGALEALENLKAQGVIGHIGLGQRRHDFHRRAITSGRFDVILTYNDYHPVRTTALTSGLLAEAAARAVGVLNGSPFAHGLLAGDPDANPARLRSAGTREGEAAARLYRWCREQEVSMPAVILQFCVRQSLIHCTLTGAKNRAELEENLRAVTAPLPPTLWDELDALKLTEGQV